MGNTKKLLEIQPLNPPAQTEEGKKYTHFVVPEEEWADHQGVPGAIRRVLEEYCGKSSVITTLVAGKRSLVLLPDIVKENQLVKKGGTAFSSTETRQLSSTIDTIVKIAARHPEFTAEEIFERVRDFEVTLDKGTLAALRKGPEVTLG